MILQRKCLKENLLLVAGYLMLVTGCLWIPLLFEAKKNDSRKDEKIAEVDRDMESAWFFASALVG